MTKTTKWLRTAIVTVLSVTAGPLFAQPAGQWDFNGNLNAAAGSVLTTAVTYNDGPSGATAAGTSFSTTTSFGISDIGGAPATVMSFPKLTSSSGGFRMPVPATGNGFPGALDVNTWSLAMDVLFPPGSVDKARAILDIKTLAEAANANGAEVFIGTNNAVSFGGASGGTLVANTWYRIVLVCEYKDLEGNADQVVLTRYINGTRAGDPQIINLTTPTDGAWALNTLNQYAGLLTESFSTPAVPRSEAGYLSSLQLRTVAMTPGQVAALGTPTASKIPQVIPPVPSYVESFVPAGAYARGSTEIKFVLQSGDSSLSNFQVLLNGVAQTANVVPASPGPNTQVTVTVAAQGLAALTDYTATLNYTDSAFGAKTFPISFRVPILYEDFELLVLGPKVDEALAGANVFTPTPPFGWDVNQTSKDGLTPMYGVNPVDPVNGVTEFRGWTFLNKNWWATTAGDQDRTLYTLGKGTVAVADPDEWDDKGDPESLGSFNSKLVTPVIDISSAGVGTAFVSFDSSTRTEEPQEIYITVSFNGGAQTEVLRWNDSPGAVGPPVVPPGPNHKPDAPNERITIPLNNPVGATTVQVRFGLEKAKNDWWWALDNIVVDAGPIPVSFTQQPASANVTIGSPVTFTAAVAGTAPFTYQWFKGTGNDRTAIGGATSSSYTIPSVAGTDTGYYSVSVTNGAGTQNSSAALLYALSVATPSGDVAGQWDFENGNLTATVGADMVYFEGPGGPTAAATAFGSTTTLGIPDIDGTPANVMAFGAPGPRNGYLAATGAPNGGPTAKEKNVYTMIYDILWPAAVNANWRTFAQITPIENTDDAEFFVNTSGAIGVGNTGYHGNLAGGAWHRVVIAVDLTVSANPVRYYIDGTFVGQGGTPGIDGRFGLPGAVNFFADNDGDNRPGYISSLQVRNVALTQLEVAALGGPKASGIPLVIDTSTVKPVIASQPVGVFLSPGGNLTLSVAVQSSLPVTFQWYRNDQPVAGATSASLTINNALDSEAGSYRVDITNANGTTGSSVAMVGMATDINADLVVHLPFDSNLNDVSGRGNNASVGAGSTPLASGLIGQAVTVSTTVAGGRNYVTLGAPTDLNFGTATDFSVSFWINSPGRSSDPSFIGNKNWGSGSNPGWVLFADGNKLGMNIAPTRVDRGAAANDPTIVGTGWNHVTGVFDRDGLFTAYVNGVALGTANLATASRNVDTPVGLATNIGEDGTGTYNDINDGSPGFAQGTLIDDVGIWRRRLTASEVAAIHQGGRAGKSLDQVTGVTLGTLTSTPVSGGTALQFDWRGQPGARLQWTSDVVNGLWEDVPGSTGLSSIFVPIGTGKEFYRLILP